jgi:heme oxygenase (mycobilin-producing)
MAIKVAIYRKMSLQQKVAIKPMLTKLTTLAVSQPGYLDGECLVSMDDPEDHMTLCSWRSRSDWEHFSKLTQARELHEQIDLLLDRPTRHCFYEEM